MGRFEKRQSEVGSQAYNNYHELEKIFIGRFYLIRVNTPPRAANYKIKLTVGIPRSFQQGSFNSFKQTKPLIRLSGNIYEPGRSPKNNSTATTRPQTLSLHRPIVDHGSRRRALFKDKRNSRNPSGRLRPISTGFASVESLRTHILNSTMRILKNTFQVIRHPEEHNLWII
jgi:hypothetical protein